MRRLAQCRRMTAPDRRIAAFVWTCLLLATLAGLSLWAILAGPFPLSFSDLPTLSPAQHSVLFNLRLPRLVAAIGIGGGLAISGFRSDERRVGKECVSPCRSRGAPST